MSEKISVLFVCHGNICRSPAAEGNFHHLIKKRKLENQFEIDSAGTAGYHIGENPHPDTCRAAEESGVTLSHRARQFSKADFQKYDFIIAMDEVNIAEIMRLAASEKDRAKVLKFRQFDPVTNEEPKRKRPHGSVPDVPDPYYGGFRGFQNVQSIVERTVEPLLEWLLEQKSS